MHAPRCLSGQGLKLLAMAAMLCDHVAWAFLPITSPLAALLHTLGAAAMPIFAFFIAQGYHHTRSLRGYLRRLTLFAGISYLPFVFFIHRALGEPLDPAAFFRFNIIFTFILGLLALHLWQREADPGRRILGMGLILALSLFCDGMVFPVLLILVMGTLRGEPRRALTAGAAVSLLLVAFFTLADPQSTSGGLWGWYATTGYRLGALAAYGLLSLYSGQRGRGSRWLFYIFYPLHLSVLALLTLL